MASLSLGRPGWAVTEFPACSGRPFSREAQARLMVALACFRRMVTLELQGQNQQVTLVFTQSPLQFSQ